MQFPVQIYMKIYLQRLEIKHFSVSWLIIR
uniref:Uncharacterized protein n=1 Tax=Dulem virus 42 TaxID=3145760 RepID=A0AAU8BAK5_9CAUD